MQQSCGFSTQVVAITAWSLPTNLSSRTYLPFLVKTACVFSLKPVSYMPDLSMVE